MLPCAHPQWRKRCVMLIRVVLRPMSYMISFAGRHQGPRVALGAVPRPFKIDIFGPGCAIFFKVSTLRAVNAQRKCVVLKRGVGGWGVIAPRHLC